MAYLLNMCLYKKDSQFENPMPQYIPKPIDNAGDS